MIQPTMSQSRRGERTEAGTSHEQAGETEAVNGGGADSTERREAS